MVVNKIIIHCSATTPNMDIGVAEIDRWHRLNGWNGCGYHFVIRKDGSIERGRKVGEKGAHARGFNESSVGICLVGGLDEDAKPSSEYSGEQIDSLDHLLYSLQWVLDIDKVNVVGHRDLPGVFKDCPCFDVKTWLETGELKEPRQV